LHLKPLLWLTSFCCIIHEERRTLLGFHSINTSPLHLSQVAGVSHDGFTHQSLGFYFAPAEPPSDLASTRLSTNNPTTRSTYWQSNVVESKSIVALQFVKIWCQEINLQWANIRKAGSMTSWRKIWLKEDVFGEYADGIEVERASGKYTVHLRWKETKFDNPLEQMMRVMKALAQWFPTGEELHEFRGGISTL